MDLKTRILVLKVQPLEKRHYIIFTQNYMSYNHIWFIEEDVFIPTLDTIKNIDLKYPDNDLLVKSRNM